MDVVKGLWNRLLLMKVDWDLRFCNCIWDLGWDYKEVDGEKKNRGEKNNGLLMNYGLMFIRFGKENFMGEKIMK